MCGIRENRIMHTHEESRLRLIMSTLLVAVFASYIGNSQADENINDHGRISKINSSIQLHSQEWADELRTVNGRILLREGSAAGKAETVNGSIQLDDGVRIGSAKTVNGAIRVSRDVHVHGSLETVNGSIRLESGAQVQGEVRNVNGAIALDGGTVAGDLRTVNGRVSLRHDSTVHGDLIIDEGRRTGGFFSRLFLHNRSNTPGQIDIDATSRVDGDIHLYRETRLNIHADAVTGEIHHHY